MLKLADNHIIKGGVKQELFDKLYNNIKEDETILLKRKSQVKRKLSNPEKFVDFALDLCQNLKEM